MKIKSDKLQDRDGDIVQLILDVRAGDNAAFSALVDMYEPLLNKLSRNFVFPGVQFDELFSEACAVLHGAAMSYDISRTGVTFGLYAQICISHRLSDLVAKAARELPNVDIDLDTIPIENTVEARLVGRERVRKYMEFARSVLSDYEYEVFELYIQGYTTAEISERLGKPAKSVDNAKARIFKSLRRHNGMISVDD